MKLPNVFCSKSYVYFEGSKACRKELNFLQRFWRFLGGYRETHLAVVADIAQKTLFKTPDKNLDSDIKLSVLIEKNYNKTGEYLESELATFKDSSKNVKIKGVIEKNHACHFKVEYFEQSDSKKKGFFFIRLATPNTSYQFENSVDAKTIDIHGAYAMEVSHPDFLKDNLSNPENVLSKVGFLFIKKILEISTKVEKLKIAAHRCSAKDTLEFHGFKDPVSNDPTFGMTLEKKSESVSDDFFKNNTISVDFLLNKDY